MSMTQKQWDVLILRPGNSWSTQDPPALPPRSPSNPASAPPFSHSSPHFKEPAQHGKFPGPPPTAPPGHPTAQSSYNFHTSRLLPGGRYSPIETGWNQSSHSIASLDTSTWGVNYHHNQSQHAQPGLRPPLPVSSPALRIAFHS